jgi:hypothetical protein
VIDRVRRERKQTRNKPAIRELRCATGGAPGRHAANHSAEPSAAALVGGKDHAIHARGDASGFFKLMSPIMNRMVRRNIRRDLEALAKRLTAE